MPTSLTVITALSFVVIAIVALNNATSTESLWPLSVVCAAGLIAMGLGGRKSKD